MKRKSVRTSIIVLLVFVLTAMTGCGQTETKEKNDEMINKESAYPIIKEEYQDEFKLTMMAPSYYTVDVDWENNKFFERMNELTGVDFVFNIYNYDMYGTKKPLVLTTPSQMPDFFMKALFDKTEVVKYGMQGLIIPLEDLINEYMPNLKKLMDNDPEIAKLITAPDGHIYALPQVGEKDSYAFTAIPWINQEWLNNLDLEMPTTPEDFYNVMVAFRDNDPNLNGIKDEIPMLISQPHEMNYFFSFFGIDMEHFLQIGKDGVIEFGPETDRYKEALEWIQRLYAEGLINQNYETYSVSQKWIDAKQGDISTVGYFVDYAAWPVVGIDRADEYITLDTVKNEYFGDVRWYGTYNVTDGCFVITKQCEYPEVLARWIDVMYDPEYSMWAVIGKEGEEWAWDDDAKTSWSYLIPEEQRTSHLSTATIQGGGGMPYYIPTSDFNSKCSDEYYANTEIQIAKIQKIGFEGFPVIYLKDMVAIKQASVMYTDINTYIEQIKNKVIKGASIEDAYADYSSMREKLNIEGFISLYIEGYEIYLDR